MRTKYPKCTCKSNSTTTTNRERVICQTITTLMSTLAYSSINRINSTPLTSWDLKRYLETVLILMLSRWKSKEWAAYNSCESLMLNHSNNFKVKNLRREWVAYNIIWGSPMFNYHNNNLQVIKHCSTIPFQLMLAFRQTKNTLLRKWQNN